MSPGISTGSPIARRVLRVGSWLNVRLGNLSSACRGSREPDDRFFRFVAGEWVFRLLSDLDDFAFVLLSFSLFFAAQRRRKSESQFCEDLLFRFVEPAFQYPIVNTLTEAHVRQLHLLYQHEWWTVGRSLADVRTMLQHSDFIFGIIAPDSHQLLAFGRVLTDRVFKALLLDVIIHPDHRFTGLGSFLVAHIIAHPVISRVRHIELYCLPERTDFYRRHGFTADLGDLQFLRRPNEHQSNENPCS